MELLPCPFCGTFPSVVSRPLQVISKKPLNLHRIVCQNAECPVMSATTEAGTQEEAAWRWNNRTAKVAA